MLKGNTKSKDIISCLLEKGKNNVKDEIAQWLWLNHQAIWKEEKSIHGQKDHLF